MTQVYNLALVFEEELAEKIKELRLRVASDNSEAASFDQISVSCPHLTLVQFEADRKIAEQVWLSFAERWAGNVALDLAGLTVLPSARGGAWVEISVLKSKELSALQDIACGAVGTSKPLNRVGDSYRPHITILRLSGECNSVSLPFDSTVVRAKNVRVTPAMGIGEHFGERPAFELRRE